MFTKTAKSSHSLLRPVRHDDRDDSEHDDRRKIDFADLRKATFQAGAQRDQSIYEFHQISGCSFKPDFVIFIQILLNLSGDSGSEDDEKTRRTFGRRRRSFVERHSQGVTSFWHKFYHIKSSRICTKTLVILN